MDHFVSFVETEYDDKHVTRDTWASPLVRGFRWPPLVFDASFVVVLNVSCWYVNCASQPYLFEFGVRVCVTGHDVRILQKRIVRDASSHSCV